ncbi:BglII/BstYI family type II restriction endonuclease [Propylenella binzhouense]
MLFDDLKARGFDVLALHHAEAIITHDMPEAEKDIDRVLCSLEIPITELVAGGGGEAQGTQRMRRALSDLGWVKRNIGIRKTVRWDDESDEQVVASLSHEIDHVKTFGPMNWAIALEIEWNNKDPFFDRDLENFKRLHAEGAISVGALITRGESLHRSMRTLLRRFIDQKGIDAVEALGEFGYRPTRRQQDIIERAAKRSGDFRQAWVDAFVRAESDQVASYPAALK